MLFGFILLLCVLIFSSTTGHCASEEPISYELPYNFNVFDANNTLCLEYNEDIIQAGINWNNDIASYNWNNYIVYPLELNWNSYGEVQLKYLFNPRIEYDVPADINYFNTGITITYDSTITFDVLFDSPITPFEFSSWGAGGSGSTNVCGSFLPYDTGKGSIQRFYPFYSSNDLYDTNGDLIFGYITNPVINYGHATPPAEFNNPFFNPNSHAQPPEEVPPQVTINNYTWNTYNPPTIDDTDIISTLKSLIDVVNYLAGWLKDNLAGEFQNLLSNLKLFFDYIGQTIQYYGGLIIDNIQNGIQTFYNNMVSLIEPISTAIDYISQPLQVSEVVTAIQSTAIHTDIVSVVNLSNTAFGIFGTVSEPSEFKIPLDLTGITILHQTQPFYIDLAWINSAKSYIRAFMWCVVTFGLLYSIIIGIPSMLNDSK